LPRPKRDSAPCECDPRSDMGTSSRARRASPPVEKAGRKLCMLRLRLGPNVEGNRRADEKLAEDQTVYRRVRLTVRLGHIVHPRRPLVLNVLELQDWLEPVCNLDKPVALVECPSSEIPGVRVEP
jgi:hypothetical protein